MEARKITIVQTRNQKKSVITTSATTLGELKDDLRTNGIDYDGMTFYEGLSKTELKTDESILPHDIERNGVITNELVFMLTNAEKKIKSGAMSRAEAYDAIKKNNLQAKCLKEFGKNFTMCKTADLILLVENSLMNEPKKSEVMEAVTPAAPANDEPCNCKGCVDTQARAAITKLVEMLEGEGALVDYQVQEVLDILGGTVEAPAKQDSGSKCPYTDDEINQMFRGMK